MGGLEGFWGSSDICCVYYMRLCEPDREEGESLSKQKKHCVQSHRAEESVAWLGGLQIFQYVSSLGSVGTEEMNLECEFYLGPQRDFRH